MKKMQARDKQQVPKVKKESREANLRQLAGLKRAREEDDGDDPVTEVENPHKKARIEVVELDDD